MPNKCWSPVLGKRIRVTELDACGNVPVATTANAYVATDGFISVTLSSEVEDGTEIITRKADGTLCVNEKLANSFKRFTAEIEFCGVNPALLALVSNAEEYLDYADDIAGVTVGEGTIEKNFALELWTGISGAACLPGQTFYGGYLLLPFLRAGVLGNIEVNGENAVSFMLTGAYTQGGNAWGVGPYQVVLNDDVPGVADFLPTALDPDDHMLIIDTSVSPPPSACGAQPMPPVNANIAYAGIPGTWGPFGYVAPTTFTQANTWGVVASPNTLWTVGQNVQGSTPGAPGVMHWTGTAWALGAAPA